jgi:hypothetical protein
MKRFPSSRIAVSCLAALSGLAAPTAVLATEPTFSLGVGAEYTTGDYGGDASVDEVYVPVTATYDANRVSLRLTVPFLSVRAPEGTIIEGPDGQPIVGEGPRTTESGLGDIVAAATVFDVLRSSTGDVALDVTGKVKFGTADEDKGLGTGEQDYTLQADLFRFYERFTAIGTAGYTFRGDPEGVNLNDAFFASLGGTYAVSSTVRCGAFYDFREASYPGNDDMHEVSVFAAIRFSDAWRLQSYLLAGFTDSSPEWGLGMTATRRF